MVETQSLGIIFPFDLKLSSFEVNLKLFTIKVYKDKNGANLTLTADSVDKLPSVWFGPIEIEYKKETVVKKAAIVKRRYTLPAIGLYKIGDYELTLAEVDDKRQNRKEVNRLAKALKANEALAVCRKHFGNTHYAMKLLGHLGIATLKI